MRLEGAWSDGLDPDVSGFPLAAWQHPVAHERLGYLYEEMGRPEDAAKAYKRFVEAWENTDPGLQSRVEEAAE